MLKRIKKFFKRSKMRYDYHTLYHRVGRRLGVARAERRQLLVENEGLRERLQKQFSKLLDLLHERDDMRRQISDMRKQLEAIPQQSSDSVKLPAQVSVSVPR